MHPALQATPQKTASTQLFEGERPKKGGKPRGGETREDGREDLGLNAGAGNVTAVRPAGKIAQMQVGEGRNMRNRDKH